MMRAPCSGRKRPHNPAAMRSIPRPAVFLLALLLGLGSAHAETRTFLPGSLVIPMDACYQAVPDAPKPSSCVDGKAPDDGAIKAYGLVYLLLKKGITIYLVINPDKTRIDAVDFSITHAGGSGAPVGLWDRGSQSARDFTRQGTVSYRGAPFVIDAGDAPGVMRALALDPLISTFTSVAVHVARDSFQAPVTQRMHGVPPKIAVFAPPASQGGTAGTEGIPLMEAYLLRAGLHYPGSFGTVASPGDIYDVLYPTDISSGVLGTRYQVLWVPHYDAGGGDRSVLDAFAAFADAGGMIFAECASIQSFENYAPTRFMTSSGVTINTLSSCYPGDTNGFNAHGFSTVMGTMACYDPVKPVANYSGAGLNFGVPSNPFVQIGDFSFFKARGAVEDYRPIPASRWGWGSWGGSGWWGSWGGSWGGSSSGGTWDSYVLHLLASQDASPSLNQVGILSMVFKDGDSRKGQVLYFGGHFYGDRDAPVTSGIRIVLNTLLFARPTMANLYQSRSTPLLAPVGGKLLFLVGSYLENNNAIPPFGGATDVAWPFPQVLGRYTAYDASSFSGGSTQGIGDGTGSLWEAAGLVPQASARQLYTSSGTGAGAAFVNLDATGLAALGTNPFGLPSGSPADTSALLGRVRGAALGGIDHSTAAIVGPHVLIAGGATRPTVAYAGARDGMLHAFQIDGGAPGTELWGFLPGEQLQQVRLNQAALDAAPNVGDIFESFGGKRSWRTLLTIAQGRGGPALYGLDVSNPQQPQLLWQRGTAPSGVTLGMAGGSALTIVRAPQNPFQSVVVVASSEPAGPAGLLVTGLRGADGAALWQFSHAYGRPLPNGTRAIVPNDLPATPALGASKNSVFVDRVYAPDLEGRVWELDALTGGNVNGQGPLFDAGLTAGGKLQPIGASPVLYQDRGTGHLALLLVTGGMDWADAGEVYAVYAVDLDPAVRVADTGHGAAPLIFKTALAAGQKGYSPPAVSGNDVYLLASGGNLGGAIGATLADAATLYRINLSSGAASYSRVLTKGMGAFQTATGAIYGATARDLIVDTPAGADGGGKALRPASPTPIIPRIWFETR